MLNADRIGTRTTKELDLLYDYLLSGNSEKIHAAREVIATLKEDVPTLLSLDVVDKVKRWINQDKNDPDAKKRALLKEIWHGAKDPGDNLPHDKRWPYKGRTARGLFYAGRFKKARIRFRDSLNEMGNPANLKPGEKKVAYDIWVAAAEMQVYIGSPDA